MAYHPTNELMDWVLSKIHAGDSQAELALQLGIGTATLSGWLCDESQFEGITERSAHARQASAEAWLDKGLAVLRAAMDDPAYQGGGTDSGAARAYAQECARRAAIRNPQYRDKTGVEVSGPGGGPIKTIAATATPEQAAALYKEIIG